MESKAKSHGQKTRQKADHRGLEEMNMSGEEKKKLESKLWVIADELKSL